MQVVRLRTKRTRSSLRPRCENKQLDNEMVKRALEKRGKNVRFIFSWDDYDVFRKIPKNMPKHDMLEKYLGSIQVINNAIDIFFQFYSTVIYINDNFFFPYF